MASASNEAQHTKLAHQDILRGNAQQMNVCHFLELKFHKIGILNTHRSKGQYFGIVLSIAIKDVVDIIDQCHREMSLLFLLLNSQQA